MATKLHEILYVSKRTGLGVHRIRAWERRHQAVVPDRTATRRRLYSESDIRRLQLLRRAVDDGHRISTIGRMSLDALLKLVNQNTVVEPSRSEEGVEPPPDHRTNLAEAALAAVQNLDSLKLENLLGQAMVGLSRRSFIDQFIPDLFRQIGRGWVHGRVGIAHEHMASAVARSLLGEMLRTAEIAADAKGIVVATPSGQHHELAAMVVALAAADAGWRPVMLGASLPADDIIAAVQQTDSTAVGLSIKTSAHGEALVLDIRKLGRHLSGRALLLAGGQVNRSAWIALNGAGFQWCASLQAFHYALLDANMLPKEVFP